MRPAYPAQQGESDVETIIFIQVHGRPGILEAELSEAATLGELHDALAAVGVPVDAETFIFIDEAEDHLQGTVTNRSQASSTARASM